MQPQEQDISKKLSWKKILIPIVLGLTAAFYLLFQNIQAERFVKVESGAGQYIWQDSNGNGKVDVDLAADFILSEDGNYILKSSGDILSELDWTWTMTFWLCMALLMVVIRDFGYMYRLRVITDRKLSWRKTFDVIMLWEFASALTPSVVGGSGVAVFILNREGINLGKSTATIFVTALMDEGFYIIMVPIVFLIIGMEPLFPEEWLGGSLGSNSIHVLFWMGYGFILLLTTAISLSIFRFPHLFKRILMRIFTIRILRRWLRRVIQLGDEIIISSRELKGQKWDYWVKAFGATLFSWTARFWTLNFIILMFVSEIDHLIVFGRQLVMWVIMLISPTPGSSGVAEIALASFFEGVIIPVAFVAIVAIIWRLLTYFPYLFLGAFILPRWLRRTAKESVENHT